LSTGTHENGAKAQDPPFPERGTLISVTDLQGGVTY